MSGDGINIKNLTVWLGGRTILDNLSLSVPAVGVTLITGPSGCGKSTLMGCIAGLLKYEGKIEGVQEKTLSAVFQDSRLLPNLTVHENVTLVLKKGQGELADKWLDYVRLTDDAKKYPAELSGGMQRRTAIARAMAYGAQYTNTLYLLDEPFTGLDDALKQDILSKIIQTAEKAPIIIITHDEINKTESIIMNYEL